MATSKLATESLLSHDPFVDLEDDESVESPAVPSATVQSPAIMTHDPFAGLEDEPLFLDTPVPPVNSGGLRYAPASGDDARPVLDLGSVFGIPDVAEAKERFMALMNQHGTITIRAGSLERIDGAGIQFLCAMVREAGQMDLRLQWEGVTDVLQQLINLLGMTDDLSLGNPSG